MNSQELKIFRKSEFLTVKNMIEFKTPNAKLIGVKGRRRAGKSFFVEELMKQFSQQEDCLSHSYCRTI